MWVKLHIAAKSPENNYLRVRLTESILIEVID
jgi:hypothetical protein